MTSLLISLFITFYQSPPTEIILLGTVHQPVENFNADSLYNVLVDIEPDVILYESDSSFFTDSLTLKEQENGGNEYHATIRYAKNFPVKVRPYEFEGRNEYRIEQGIRPTDSFVQELLDSLYRHRALNEEQQTFMRQYHQLSDSLESFGLKGVQSFNNDTTDNLAKDRQYAQYQRLQTIVDQRKEFVENTHIKPDGQPITYREAYRRAGQFWNTRNQTMAQNILMAIIRNPGAKIVVLNGYFHRYYLKAELEKVQTGENFVLKDVDEYY